MSRKVQIIYYHQSRGFASDAQLISSNLVGVDCQIMVGKKIEKGNILNIYIPHLPSVSNFRKTSKFVAILPNYEQILSSYKDATLMNLNNLHHVDYVLCKTNQTMHVYQQLQEKLKFNYKLIYIGFTTIFKPIKIAKNWNQVIHFAGQHHWKQTDVVIKTWQQYGDQLPPIKVVCYDLCFKKLRKYIDLDNLPSNLEFQSTELPYEQYVREKCQAGIHICCSFHEGYGHYINESILCKSLVITTNKQPMSEFISNKSGILINCSKQTHYVRYSQDSEVQQIIDLFQICYIEPEQLKDAVLKAVALTKDQRDKMTQLAFDNFVKRQEQFTKNMQKLSKMINKLPLDK